MESQISNSRVHPALVSRWLMLCALLVFAMAVVGAMTRLTESGLSITQWRPIMGALPPMSSTDWAHVFDLYQQTPEYKHKNMGMSLGEFKQIYWWEWGHRLLGRIIGLVFFVPLVWFWLMGWTPRGLTLKLQLLLLLGATQGFVGWFMVQSGLIDRPSVSHYRLALHLGIALLIYSILIWLALSVRRLYNTRPLILPTHVLCLRLHGILALLILAATIIWGAFVAGLDAGLIYNEFPTMGHGRLWPKEMWHLTPDWLNIFENHAAVQFIHRLLGIASVVMILSFVAHAMLRDLPGRRFPLVALMVLVQAGLGIATLLSGVNIYIAATHQAGALTLLGLMTACLHMVFTRPYTITTRA